MFGWFKRNPVKKLEKEIAAKRAKAVAIQRSGDLRSYANIIAEIEELEDCLVELNTTESN